MDKRAVYHTYYILILLFLSISCSQKETTDKLLKESGLLIEQHPEKALEILGNIDANKLNEKQEALYWVLHTQAKDKCYMNISEDTLVFKSADYFQEQNNNENAAKAHLYSGRVLWQQNNLKLALSHTLEAKKYALRVYDPDLLGLIHFDLGQMYQDDFNIPEAEKSYLAAQKYFSMAGNEKNAVYISIFLGDLHLLKNPPEPDFALNNYNYALKEATRLNDSLRIAEIYRMMATLYAKFKNNYTESNKCIFKALNINPTDNFLDLNYEILSMNYLHLNMQDSALYYVNKIQNITGIEKDWKFRHNYHVLLFNIHKHSNNLDSAIYHHEQMALYTDSIYTKNKDQSVLEIQNKYDKAELQNQLAKKAILRLQLWIILISISVLALSVILILRRQMKIKTQRLAEAQLALETLSRMADEKQNSSSDKIRGLLSSELIRLKSTATQLGAYDKNSEKPDIWKINKLLTSHLQSILNWDNIYEAMNMNYNHFSDVLDRKYPNLTLKEKQLCCLLCAKFSPEEIVLLLSYQNINSIYVLKKRLREKMGFENVERFNEFFAQFNA